MGTSDRKGFSLLEVLIAVAIMGIAFSSFIALSTKNLELSGKSLKLTLSTVAAHDILDEEVYLGRDRGEGVFNIANVTLDFKEDFENVMGYTVSKVSIVDEKGYIVEIYEVK